jgi:hypothetical protein
MKSVARAGASGRRAWNLRAAAAIGRKAALVLATGLGIAVVIVPLLALVAPEFTR